MKDAVEFLLFEPAFFKWGFSQAKAGRGGVVGSASDS